MTPGRYRAASKSIFKGTMFRYSTVSHRGNIKSYFLKNASLITSTCRQPASFGRLLIILQHRGFGWGLFDAHAYRGAGDGWGYQGPGLPANPRQEPFGRATLKTAISAIAAGRLWRSLRTGAPIAQRHCRGIGIFGVPQPGIRTPPAPCQAHIPDRVGEPEPAAGRCRRNAPGIGLPPTLSNEQRCHKSV